MQNHTLYTAMRFDFLYADRYVFQSGWIYPESYVPYCMVRLIQKGEAFFRINGEETLVRENQVVYIPEGCMLYCETQSKSFEFISIRFRLTAQLDSGDFLADYYRIGRVTETCGDTEITEHFTEVWQSATSNAQWKRFTIRGHLELIIAWLSRKAAATIPIGKKDENAGLSIEDILKREKLTYSRTQDPRITALVDYIINHIDEEFTASKLSEMADLSESSMRRLFVKYTGKSPLEFVQDLRLVIAARRMLVTNERISSIAYSVGISNPNYFSRIFREKFGVSPHVYRKNAD